MGANIMITSQDEDRQEKGRTVNVIYGAKTAVQIELCSLDGYGKNCSDCRH